MTERHEFDIEEHDGSHLVSVDREKIAEVLRSLIDHAVRRLPDGGRIAIRVQTLGGGLVAVEVCDDGAGIGRQELSSMFSRYEEGTAGPGVLAAGPGLYLVKSLVELHGGRVWARSEPTAGTTLSFTLPRADRAAAPASTGGAGVAEVAGQATPAGRA